jgi:tetratricopeptide (TPR) repeat protein
MTKDQTQKKKLSRTIAVKKNGQPGVTEQVSQLSMFSGEMLYRVVTRMLADGSIKDRQAVEAALSMVLTDQDAGQVLRVTGTDFNRQELAQLWAFQALEALDDGDINLALAYCHESLQIDSENLDALRIRGLEEIHSEAARIPFLEQLLAGERSRLGDAFLKKSPSQRCLSPYVFPYLRTLYDYGRVLLEEHEVEKAIAVMDEGLALDPQDSQGFRVVQLMGMLLVKDFKRFDAGLILLHDQYKRLGEDFQQVGLFEIYGLFGRGEKALAQERLFHFLNISPGVADAFAAPFVQLAEEDEIPLPLRLDVSEEAIHTVTDILQDLVLLGKEYQGWFVERVLFWLIQREGACSSGRSGGFWGMDSGFEEIRDVLVELTGGFCDTFLDAHCGEVCGRIVKRLSDSQLDLDRSLPESWAAGIIHFMGKQNNMFGSTHPKHFKAGSIATHFDISHATCLNKSKQIHSELSRMGVNDASLWGAGDAEGGAGKPVPVSKKSRKKSSSDERNLQLKIVLRGVRPPVWRRVVVPDYLTLGEFHDVIQDVMGWYNCHLHQFEVNGRVYSDPSFELDMGFFDVENEDRVRLGQVLSVSGDKIFYEYDFGDGWQHVVTLEKELPPDSAGPLMVCLKGKRACPPEDCGGPWGYEHLLEVLSDPEHEEYEDMTEWAGDYFEPEEFDLEFVNKALAKLARSFKKRKRR